jgi:hypothetical protein
MERAERRRDSDVAETNSCGVSLALCRLCIDCTEK